MILLKLININFISVFLLYLFYIFFSAGAVVTMPGCLDQTIHADTEHLFDHVQVHLRNTHSHIESIL